MGAVAVVTGAGRGFGRATARLLADRGYDVLATDVDEEDARQPGVTAMALDVRDPDAHRAVAAAAGERGPVEVWVNNAGVLRTEKAWEHHDDDVRLTVDANLLGVIWGSRAAVDAMRGQPRGDIVNLGSLSSLSPSPGLAVYGATKYGVMGFSSSLQGDLKLAGEKIRVHVLCPAGGNTGMVRENQDNEDSSLIFSTGPRLLQPEEVAEAVVSLIGTKKMVLTVPRYQGMLRAGGIAPRPMLSLLPLLQRLGDRRRQRA